MSGPRARALHAQRDEPRGHKERSQGEERVVRFTQAEEARASCGRADCAAKERNIDEGVYCGWCPQQCVLGRRE